MNIETLKITLAQKLLAVSDAVVLGRVQEALETEADPIVAHTTGGKPLRLSQYKEKLDRSMESARAGNVYTTEEVKAHLSRWKTQ
ncbi:hypothetical protein N8482_03170 [Chitinophagales bacterium]|nr:hypothetical protein [Chitinophagales bacterium]